MQRLLPVGFRPRRIRLDGGLVHEIVKVPKGLFYFVGLHFLDQLGIVERRCRALLGRDDLPDIAPEGFGSRGGHGGLFGLESQFLRIPGREILASGSLVAVFVVPVASGDLFRQVPALHPDGVVVVHADLLAVDGVDFGGVACGLEEGDLGFGHAELLGQLRLERLLDIRVQDRVLRGEAEAVFVDDVGGVEVVLRPAVALDREHQLLELLR